MTIIKGMPSQILVIRQAVNAPHFVELVALGVEVQDDSMCDSHKVNPAKGRCLMNSRSTTFDNYSPRNRPPGTSLATAYDRVPSGRGLARSRDTVGVVGSN